MNAHVIDRFRAHAQKTPNCCALKQEKNIFTYAWLDKKSDQLASVLSQATDEEDALCFVLVDSIVDTVVALLSVFKSKKIFVPINLDFPDTRIQKLIDDYKPQWCIVDEVGMGRLFAIETQHSEAVSYKTCRSDLSHHQHDEFSASFICEEPFHWVATSDISQDDDTPCYIYFTSGSTGKAKAILGSIKSVNHFIDWEINFLDFSDKISSVIKSSQLINPSFDAFLRDVFVPLCSGGQLCIPPRINGHIDADRLAKWLNDSKVNLIHCGPTLLMDLLSNGLRSQDLSELNTVLLSGERLFPENIQKFYDVFGDRIKLVNLYGPSETTMVKFSYIIDFSKDRSREISIGQPIPGCRALLVDQQLKPCAPGSVGEIILRTPYRSLGYFRDKALTQQFFIANPFSNDSKDIVYKTGDLGVVNEDGNFLLRGRVDEQIKLRGIRVEPGEIESCILKHDAVNAVVVLLSEHTQQLCALIQSEKKIDQKEIRGFVSNWLPVALIPSFFIVVKQFPLTYSGKVDRKKLKINLKELISTESIPFVAPSNLTELTLTDIWSDLLQVNKLSVHDNFFQKGGHSLLVVRLIAEIKKILNVELPIKTVFTNPTIIELALCINKQNQALTETLASTPRCDEDIPLSFAQSRLWVIDKLKGSKPYHVTMAFQLQGNLNREALEQSLRSILERHESLRTVFYEKQGNPFQVICSAKKWKLHFDRRNDLNDNILLSEWIDQQSSLSYDLSKDFLLRCFLAEIDQKNHILLINMHHIATDGWSKSLFLKELVEFYNAQCEHRAASVIDLPLQYADFSLWQQSSNEGEKLERKLQYWVKTLTGVETLNLPTDFPRPTIQSSQGDVKNWPIEKKLTENLRLLAFKSQCTLYMVLLAAFKVLLYHYTRQTDICVGIPAANRTKPQLQNLIGLFVNTLALRSDLGGNPSFDDVLIKVRASTLDGLEHQEVPFERIVDAMGLPRDLNSNPLVQVMFLLQSSLGSADLGLQSLHCHPIQYKQQQAKFDLTFSWIEEDPLVLSVEYCSDLFTATTIDGMMECYLNILSAVVADSSLAVNDIPLLNHSQEYQLLHSFNNTALRFPKNLTLLDLIDQQVRKNPQATAVRCEGQSLSYAQLNTQSNQMAHYIKTQSDIEKTLIGVCLDRSLNMIITLLAILKTGSAYVPIDPRAPKERIHYIIKDTELSVLVVSKEYHNVFTGLFEPRVILIDAECEDIKKYSTADANYRVEYNDLAYVIYTSGSTGSPKGVMIEHQSIVNYLQWIQATFPLQYSDVHLQKTNYCFDVSVAELFWPLSVGAELFFAKPEGHKDCDYLIDVIVREKITVIHFVPSMLEIFLHQAPSDTLDNVKWLRCSGEILEADLVKRFCDKFKHTQLSNLYGPTEATIDVSCWTVPKMGQTSPLVPIGTPVANTRFYVLNQHNNLVPIGVPGQLHVAGIQVARGYLGKEQLTQNSFLPNPFENNSDSYLYKTGDLVKWLPNGNIHYLGRIDNQVKIRGYRVELGEIETVLRRCPGVRQAVVLYRKSQQGRNVLAGYYVSADEVEKDDIFYFLNTSLPNYMVPDVLIAVTEIPLTVNQKLDTRALAIPDLSNKGGSCVSPSSTLEYQLVEIWKKHLKVRLFGIQDNFFNLGGNSLLAVIVASDIKKILHLHTFPVMLMFKHTTIAQQATVIEQMRDQPAYPSHHQNIITLQSAGDGNPIFIIPGVGGFCDTYFELAEAFNTNQPVYGIQMRGLLENESPLHSIESIAKQNIQWIKEIQPQGPYRLIGHSFGGLVAYEMAKQLESNKELLDKVVILDIAAENYKKNSEKKLEQVLYSIKGFLERVDIADILPLGWENILRNELSFNSFEELWNQVQTFLISAGLENDELDTFKRVIYLNFSNLSISYVIEDALHSPLTVIKAQQQNWQCYTHALNWNKHAAEIDVLTIPGDHYSIVKGDSAKHLAEGLGFCR